MRRHDTLAREQLFATVRPQLERYIKVQARGMGLEHRFIEEACDSSLSKMHLQLPSLRDPEKLIPWLHRIARNELLRACGEQRRVAIFSDPEDYRAHLERAGVSPYPFDPEFMLEMREVLDEIASLPDGQRSVLILRQLLQLDIEETAGLLKISPGTVKSQQHDAIRNLRARLGDGAS